MTQEQIREQIDALKRVGAKVRRTPETARQFLINAGIIEDEPKTKLKPLEKKIRK